MKIYPQRRCFLNLASIWAEPSQKLPPAGRRRGSSLGNEEEIRKDWQGSTGRLKRQPQRHVTHSCVIQQWINRPPEEWRKSPENCRRMPVSLPGNICWKERWGNNVFPVHVGVFLGCRWTSSFQESSEISIKILPSFPRKKRRGGLQSHIWIRGLSGCKPERFPDTGKSLGVPNPHLSHC